MRDAAARGGVAGVSDPVVRPNRGSGGDRAGQLSGRRRAGSALRRTQVLLDPGEGAAGAPDQEACQQESNHPDAEPHVEFHTLELHTGSPDVQAAAVACASTEVNDP